MAIIRVAVCDVCGKREDAIEINYDHSHETDYKVPKHWKKANGGLTSDFPKDCCSEECKRKARLQYGDFLIRQGEKIKANL